MNIITEKNIFLNGVIISLRTSLWGATGKLESDKFNVNDENIKEDQVKAMFDLLDDKSLIEEMRSIRNKAKNYIYSNSIGSKEHGLDFISKSMVIEIDEKLKAFQNEFVNIGDQLINQLDNLKKEYKKNHPNLYDDSRYPSKERLKNKIYFNWVFRSFAPPDKDILPSKMYQDELSKFKEDIMIMKEQTTNIVKDEIVKRLSALNKQVENEDKNIHKASLNAIENLIENFEKLWSGFIDNKTLKSCIKDLKKSFDGLDISNRKEENFKLEVKEMIDKATSTLKKDKLFRAIDL